KRPRRTRTVFSDDALDALEDAFQENCYPDVFQRYSLAQDIGEEESRIQVWFQNRRARSKHQRKVSNSQLKNFKSLSSRDLSASTTTLRRPSRACDQPSSSDGCRPIPPYYPVLPAYVIPALPYAPSWSSHPAMLQTPGGMVPPPLIHPRFEPSSPLWSPGFSPSFKKIFDFPSNPLSPLPSTPEVSRGAEDNLSTFRITHVGGFAERSGPDSVTLRVPSKSSSIYTPLHVPGIPAPPPRSHDAKNVSGLEDLSPADSAYSSASGSSSELQTTHLHSPTTPPSV
ncbi:hypothetical protein FSP39_006052, partial [Pinctada imbricata]